MPGGPQLEWVCTLYLSVVLKVAIYCQFVYLWNMHLTLYTRRKRFRFSSSVILRMRSNDAGDRSVIYYTQQWIRIGAMYVPVNASVAKERAFT